MSLALAILAQGAAAPAATPPPPISSPAPAPIMPWIPPLRSRSLVEVPVAAAMIPAALDNLASECARRKMTVASRTDVQLVCTSEPDAAARLSYMTARPRPDAPLEGYVRFAMQRSGGSARIQAVRFAVFRTLGEEHQILSEDTALLREMLERAQIAHR